MPYHISQHLLRLHMDMADLDITSKKINSPQQRTAILLVAYFIGFEHDYTKTLSGT